MKKTAIGLTLMAAGTLALAQPPGGGFTPPTFDGIDTDKNGSLSQAEVGVWVATIPAGAAEWAAERRRRVFGNWDANKDGSVSRAEFDARPAAG